MGQHRLALTYTHLIGSIPTAELMFPLEFLGLFQRVQKQTMETGLKY